MPEILHGCWNDYIDKKVLNREALHIGEREEVTRIQMVEEILWQEPVSFFGRL